MADGAFNSDAVSGDSASMLAAKLVEKVWELDRKVLRFTNELTAEFNKYAEELLRDQPQDVASTSRDILQKRLAELYAAGDCTAPVATSTASLSTIPEAEASSFSGVEKTRDPHARETEFHGLFTPNIVRYLDGNSLSSQRASRPYSPMEHDGKGKEVEFDVGEPDGSDSAGFRPSLPKRKNTDEQSIVSDSSDGQRKSSLRKPSDFSTSNRSPVHRKVRFASDDGPVLPTSSPTLHAYQPHPSFSSSDGNDNDSDEEPETSHLEDVNDIPLKKKISSTEKLRQLTRAPLENPEQWTQVSSASEENDEEDDVDELKTGVPNLPPHQNPQTSSTQPAVQSTNTFAWDPTPEITTSSATQSSTKSRKQNRSQATNQSPVRRATKNPGGLAEAEPNNPLYGALAHPPSQELEELDFGSEEEEPLMIAPRKKVITPPIIANASNSGENISPVPAPMSQQKPLDFTDLGNDGSSDDKVNPNHRTNIDDNDIDDVFGDFEMDDNTGTSTLEAHVGKKEEEEEEEPEPSDHESNDTPVKYDLGQPIRRLDVIPPPAASPPPRPIIGSYMGRTLTGASASDEVYAKAAKMGDIQSFVGSVSGRSGVDESNPQSYKQSIQSRGGTPGSMSERFLKEPILDEDEEI